MKFLCDQMLGELGRWLRCAGYDTLIIQNGQKDKEVLDLALADGRILLTRDRHFLEMKEAEKIVLYFKESSLEEWVEELKRRLKIQWLNKPFSRCLICNTPLHVAKGEAQLKEVPPDVQGTIWYCPTCQKAYWQGSHTERMRKQLEKWQT